MTSARTLRDVLVGTAVCGVLVLAGVGWLILREDGSERGYDDLCSSLAVEGGPGAWVAADRTLDLNRDAAASLIFSIRFGESLASTSSSFNQDLTDLADLLQRHLDPPSTPVTSDESAVLDRLDDWATAECQ